MNAIQHLRSYLGKPRIVVGILPLGVIVSALLIASACATSQPNPDRARAGRADPDAGGATQSDAAGDGEIVQGNSVAKSPRPRAVWARDGAEVLLMARKEWTLVSQRPATSDDPWIVRALRTENGEEVWESELPDMPGPLRGGAMKVGESFIVYSTSGVARLSESDGSIEWHYRLEPNSFEVASVGSTVAACSSTHRQIEFFAPSGEVSKVEFECKQLTASDGRVFALESGGDVVRFDPENGKEIWRAHRNGHEIHAAGDTLLIRKEEHWLAESDAGPGIVEAPYPATQPTLGEETTVVRSGDYALAFTIRGSWSFRLPNGSIAWKGRPIPPNSVGDDFAVAPDGSHALVFVDPDDAPGGTLARLDPSSGEATDRIRVFNGMYRLEVVDGAIVAELSTGVARLDIDDPQVPEDAETRIDVVEQFLDDPLVSNGVIRQLLRRTRFDERRAFVASRLKKLPANRIPSMLEFVVRDRIYSVIPQLALRCEELERGTGIERHFLRTVIELEDSRLAKCFESRLNDSGLGLLARQALARMATAETDELLAEHLEMLETRSYEWEPCDGPLEAYCEDDTDSDGDGIPDEVEAALFLDNGKADTDGDGLSDAEDPCPLLASKSSQTSDRDGRIETTMLTYFGTRGFAPTMVVRDRTAAVCPDGLSAPILHVDAFPEERPSGVVYGGYSVDPFQRARETFTEGDTVHHVDTPYKPDEGHRAVVTFWWGSRGHRAVLVYRSGRWLVERIEGTWAS